MTRKPRSTPPKSKASKPASGVAALAAAQASADADAADAADLEAFGPDAAPDGYAVLAALADAALAEALPGLLRARLAAGRPVAAVVAVPDSSWVGPVNDALRRMAPTVKMVARDGSMRSQHKPTNGRRYYQSAGDAAKIRRGQLRNSWPWSHRGPSGPQPSPVDPR